jgi:hypothetical protein
MKQLSQTKLTYTFLGSQFINSSIELSLEPYEFKS